MRELAGRKDWDENIMECGRNASEAEVANRK